MAIYKYLISVLFVFLFCISISYSFPADSDFCFYKANITTTSDVVATLLLQVEKMMFTFFGETLSCYKGTEKPVKGFGSGLVDTTPKDDFDDDTLYPVPSCGDDLTDWENIDPNVDKNINKKTTDTGKVCKKDSTEQGKEDVHKKKGTKVDISNPDQNTRVYTVNDESAEGTEQGVGKKEIVDVPNCEQNASQKGATGLWPEIDTVDKNINTKTNDPTRVCKIDSPDKKIIYGKTDRHIEIKTQDNGATKFYDVGGAPEYVGVQSNGNPCLQRCENVKTIDGDALHSASCNDSSGDVKEVQISFLSSLFPPAAECSGSGRSGYGNNSGIDYDKICVVTGTDNTIYTGRQFDTVGKDYLLFRYSVWSQLKPLIDDLLCSKGCTYKQLNKFGNDDDYPNTKEEDPLNCGGSSATSSGNGLMLDSYSGPFGKFATLSGSGCVGAEAFVMLPGYPPSSDMPPGKRGTIKVKGLCKSKNGDVYWKLGDLGIFPYEDGSDRHKITDNTGKMVADEVPRKTIIDAIPDIISGKPINQIFGGPGIGGGGVGNFSCSSAENTKGYAPFFDVPECPSGYDTKESVVMIDPLEKSKNIIPKVNFLDKFCYLNKNDSYAEYTVIYGPNNFAKSVYPIVGGKPASENTEKCYIITNSSDQQAPEYGSAASWPAKPNEGYEGETFVIVKNVSPDGLPQITKGGTRRGEDSEGEGQVYRKIADFEIKCVIGICDVKDGTGKLVAKNVPRKTIIDLIPELITGAKPDLFCKDPPEDGVCDLGGDKNPKQDPKPSPTLNALKNCNDLGTLNCQYSQDHYVFFDNQNYLTYVKVDACSQGETCCDLYGQAYKQVESSKTNPCPNVLKDCSLKVGDFVCDLSDGVKVFYTAKAGCLSGNCYTYFKLQKSDEGSADCKVGADYYKSDSGSSVSPCPVREGGLAYKGETCKSGLDKVNTFGNPVEEGMCCPPGQKRGTYSCEPISDDDGGGSNSVGNTSHGKPLTPYNSAQGGFQWEAEPDEYAVNVADYFAVYYVIYCTEKATMGSTTMPIACGLGTGKKGSKFTLQKQQNFSCTGDSWGTIHAFDGDQANIFALYTEYKNNGCFMVTIPINAIASKNMHPTATIISSGYTVIGSLVGSQTTISVTS